MLVANWQILKVVLVERVIVRLQMVYIVYLNIHCALKTLQYS